jgi:hypothetical protein
MPTLNRKHVRTAKQSAAMEQAEKDGVCPFCYDFCSENPLKYHTKPILKKTKWWAVTENFEPYGKAKLHLLLVYRGAHITTPDKIEVEAWVELQQIISWIIAEFNLPAGGFFFRFGDTDFTGSSVEHFHPQLIFGGEKDGEKLKVKLGYTA